MAVLRVQLEKGWVRPGERFTCRVVWHLDAPARTLEARLLWYTEGRGARDVGVTQRVELPAHELDGDREVTFQAPVGPYSFQGRLITLRWAVELAVAPGNEAEQAPLVLAPTPVPVDLTMGG